MQRCHVWEVSVCDVASSAASETKDEKKTANVIPELRALFGSLLCLQSHAIPCNEGKSVFVCRYTFISVWWTKENAKKGKVVNHFILVSFISRRFTLHRHEHTCEQREMAWMAEAAEEEAETNGISNSHRKTSNSPKSLTVISSQWMSLRKAERRWKATAEQTNEKSPKIKFSNGIELDHQFEEYVTATSGRMVNAQFSWIKNR